ncbi:MAG: ABC transporter permease, partial [Caldilinea sp.]|nr:ABC transporter permease [Caldilinea sp.]
MTATAEPLAVAKIPREGKEESQFQIVLRRFMRHKLAVAGVVVIVVMFIGALLA